MYILNRNNFDGNFSIHCKYNNVNKLTQENWILIVMQNYDFFFSNKLTSFFSTQSISFL